MSETKHTPGLSCGCYWTHNPITMGVDKFHYCSVHAAAPELLEACRLAEKQLSVIYPQASTRTYLQAAIAKTEGK